MEAAYVFALVVFEGVLFVVGVVDIMEAYIREKNSFYLLLLRSWMYVLCLGCICCGTVRKKNY